MDRARAFAFLAMLCAVVGTSRATAAEKIIEAKAPMNWGPKALDALAGDEVEWKMGAGMPGNHGLRITNWAAVKDHVEVVAVDGQQPFNATTGRNDNATNTAGKVLLRLKIKSAPPAPAKITYDCIVHGALMKGEVAIAAGKVIETKAPMAWKPDALDASVGEEVEWKMGAGATGNHGVRITNWAAVKDHVEVVAVDGQQPFNATTGRNDSDTDTPGKVLLRLKIKSAPPAPAKITYECIIHGSLMDGEIAIAAAANGAQKSR